MVGVARGCIALACAGLASAHPLHTTFTEISEDAGKRTITITVRSFTDDLSHAVTGDSPSTRTVPIAEVNRAERIDDTQRATAQTVHLREHTRAQPAVKCGRAGSV